MVLNASGTLDQEPQRTSLPPNGPVSPSSKPGFTLLPSLTCAFPSSQPADHQGHRRTWSQVSTNSLVYPPGVLEKGPLTPEIVSVQLLGKKNKSKVNRIGYSYRDNEKLYLK